MAAIWDSNAIYDCSSMDKRTIITRCDKDMTRVCHLESSSSDSKYVKATRMEQVCLHDMEKYLLDLRR